ncbi:unnamed protein product [Allacma fusca]|uniref:C3H1-type domain-containing protein n=1 Tax=Allacma fusca TaxID=39272 RepID=A0A8J2LST9_9HEXA|nr:unnamed protein product [Allacma fusca]
MPLARTNNNVSNNSGRGRGNQNSRFHRRIVNGRLQLSRRQPPQLNSNLNTIRNNQMLRLGNPSGIRRTVFNGQGGPQQIPASLIGLPNPRQFNSNRGSFFQNRQNGQPNSIFGPANNSPGNNFQNPRNSSGVLGRMEPDGTFVPINPQELFGLPPRNATFAAHPPRPLFPGFGPSPPNQNPKKILCKHYVNARGCLNRPRCNYMHEDFPCKMYHILGECTLGSECKFSHEKMSNQTKHILASLCYSRIWASGWGGGDEKQMI